ncbi:MAG: serine hydrolase domain-containing protein, partial [Dietzia cercidiphylli]
MTTDSATGHRRTLGAISVCAAVALLGSACGTPVATPGPDESPAAYSGLEVSEDAIGKITDIVEEELDASGIPGAAVAVVHGGEVVLAEGFGVRDTNTGAEVDARTVFPLASISKSVSATVVAAESANGEVDWSTPVSEYLPWFELSDPQLSPFVTVGDVFAHRSGLPGHAGDDLEDLGYDRPAVLHGLRHLPLTPFRASYAYTNFGLTAGAEAVAVAAGTPWDELGRERIFDPLGMTDTSYSHDELLERDNRAVGHVRADSPDSADQGDPDGEWVPADPQRDPDAQAPAGGRVT